MKHTIDDADHIMDSIGLILKETLINPEFPRRTDTPPFSIALSDRK